MLHLAQGAVKPWEAKRAISRTSMLNGDGIVACGFLGIFMAGKESARFTFRKLRWLNQANENDRRSRK